MDKFILNLYYKDDNDFDKSLYNKYFVLNANISIESWTFSYVIIFIVIVFSLEKFIPKNSCKIFLNNRICEIKSFDIK